MDLDSIYLIRFDTSFDVIKVEVIIFEDLILRLYKTLLNRKLFFVMPKSRSDSYSS